MGFWAYEKAPIQAKKRTYVRKQAKKGGKTPKNEALVCIGVGSQVTCEYFDSAKNQTPYNAYAKNSRLYLPCLHTHPYMTHTHLLTHGPTEQSSSAFFK